MTKISHEMHIKIRSLWVAGHHFSDIRTFLVQSGVHVSDDTIRRHCRSRRLTPATKKTTVLKVTSAVLQCIEEMLHENCGRSAKQIQNELQTRLQLKISIRTIGRYLKKLGWTYVKAQGVVGHQRRTVMDLRPELVKRDAEIEALKQQLCVCKAAHIEEMEALRSELQVCREAHADAKAVLADLQASHKSLIATHSTVIDLRSRLNCAHTPISHCLTPTRYTACGDAESREIMSSATTSIRSCYPELPFTPPTTEILESLMIQSRRRPDRFGCLLFRTVVPQAVYEEWASTTNWDGSRGKRGLPVNLRHFLMATVAQKFPSLTSDDGKRVKDRVNEFLRSPRTTVVQRRLQY